MTPVAFILRASLADMSQQEPLLVSWSLSAWSLSPCPLSLRLARSGSLNVELLGRETREVRSIYLIVFVSPPLSSLRTRMTAHSHPWVGIASVPMLLNVSVVSIFISLLLLLNVCFGVFCSATWIMNHCCGDNKELATLP